MADVERGPEHGHSDTMDSDTNMEDDYVPGSFMDARPSVEPARREPVEQPVTSSGSTVEDVRDGDGERADADSPPTAPVTATAPGPPVSESAPVPPASAPGSSITAPGPPAVPAPLSAPPEDQPELGDPDSPHLLVIESLRAQVYDLMSQVTGLNSKLVKSYDRVSDLEDDLHVARASQRAAGLKVTALELERTEHMAALNTGLLIEKEHVTAELTKMMERVMEETAQRGQAETAKAEIEHDLDDLSATLFSQANSMVAEARLDRARSARRLAECEEALKGAEDVVSIVQRQMQGIREEKEKSDMELARLKELMGKGKYVEREKEPSVLPLRLMSSHLPYREFLEFIGHLRSIRPTTQNPPPITSLLTMPFLARLVSEDSDSTIRLDLAPSLNWLTRRSVTTAIQGGLLLVEPLHTTSLVAETASNTTYSSPSDILCALCGCAVFSSHAQTPGHTAAVAAKPTSATTRTQPSSATTWSAPRFLKSNPLSSLSASRSASVPTVSRTPSVPPSPVPMPDAVIFVFRLSSQPSQKPANPYPLCQTGWCLARLRTTCELWGFVRKSVVDRVWEADTPSAEKTPPPALPPRKRMPSRIGFWGMGGASGAESTNSTRASTPANEEKPQEQPQEKPGEQPQEKPPLPRRASESPTQGNRSPTTVRRRVPPPLASGDVTSGKAGESNRSSLNGTSLPNGTHPTPAIVDSTTEPAVDHSGLVTAPSQDSAAPAEDGPSVLNGSAPNAEPAVQSEPAAPSTLDAEDARGEDPMDKAPDVGPSADDSPAAKKEPADLEATPAMDASEPDKSANATVPSPSERPSTPTRASLDRAAAPSPAPPPIPRRAAARHRVPLPAATPGSSPTKAPVPLPSDHESSPTKPTTSLPSETVPSPSNQTAPLPSEQEPLHVPRASSPVEQDDDFQSAPSSPKSKPGSPLKSKAGSPLPEVEANPLDLALSPASPTQPVANGVTLETATLPLASTLPPQVQRMQPPATPPRRLPPPKPITPVPLSPPAQASSPSVGMEAVAYTTDSSWEEKAWRELVRLREDMFLARIGVVKAGTSNL